MAYRGLGDLEQAQAHLARQGEVDPLMRELDALLESPEAYDVRGGQALDEGEWALAADYFRRGFALDAGNASLRHRLGTALFQLGDATGAEAEFGEVIRRSPEHTRAHYSLGVLMAASGRLDEATEHFSTALAYEPGYLQARLQLAAVLARTGRAGEAVAHYEQALEVDPTVGEALYGRAMALVRLQRYGEA